MADLATPFSILYLYNEISGPRPNSSPGSYETIRTSDVRNILNNPVTPTLSGISTARDNNNRGQQIVEKMSK